MAGLQLCICAKFTWTAVVLILASSEHEQWGFGQLHIESLAEGWAVLLDAVVVLLQGGLLLPAPLHHHALHVVAEHDVEGGEPVTPQPRPRAELCSQERTNCNIVITDECLCL